MSSLLERIDRFELDLVRMDTELRSLRRAVVAREPEPAHDEPAKGLVGAIRSVRRTGAAGRAGGEAAGT